MFLVSGSLLIYALLSFGGVLPHTWHVLALLWILGSGGLLVRRIVGKLEVRFQPLPLLILTGLLGLFIDLKVTAGLFAAVWAWIAASGGDRRVLKFFHFLLLIGILEGLLGLTQLFLLPGWILGYQNSALAPSGTLINRNHYAGLLEMLIPVAFGFAYIGVRRHGEMARPYIYLLAGAIMGLALLFSQSRSGIVSFLVTLAFLAAVLRLRESQRTLAAVLGLGLFVFVMAGALWIGVDVIAERFALLLEPEDAALRDGRLIVFWDTARMIASNPAGIGVGYYQDRFRGYQTFRPDLLFDHAHNDYLETAAEWGIPLAALFWSFVLFVLCRSVRAFLSNRSPERCGILIACIGAIFSILIHSLTDFNLQIPSNAMLFFTFVGIALAMSSRTQELPSTER